MMIKKSLLVFAISFSFASVFAGGGWVNQKNTGFLKLNQSVIRAENFFTSDGVSEPITTFRMFTTSFYGDYGVSDNFTATLFFPFAVRPVLNREVSSITGATIGEGDKSFGIGDITAGIKYGIVKNKPIVVAAGLYLGLPTGSTSGGTTGLLQTGDGEFNQLLQLDVSSSAGPIFGGFKLGINNRTQDFSEEFHYGTEIGLNLEKFIAIFKWDGVQSFFNGDENAGTGGSIFSNNLEFNLLSFEVGYRITEQLGLSGTYLLPLNGKSILDAPNANFGVFYQLKASN